MVTAAGWLLRSALAGDMMARVVLPQVLIANSHSLPVTEEHRAMIDVTLVLDFHRFYNPMFSLALQACLGEKFHKRLCKTKAETLDICRPWLRHRISVDEEGQWEVNSGMSGISDGDRDKFTSIIPIRMFVSGDFQQAIVLGAENGTRPMRASDVRRMIQNGYDVNDEEEFNPPPLWFACNRGNAEVGLALLEAGAKPNVRDKPQECTPLHYLSRFEPEDVEEIASALINAGGDIEAVDKINATPLTAALDPKRTFMPRSALPAVRALLALGASPCGNLRDDLVVVREDDDVTALAPCAMALACRQGQVDILEVLMDRVEELQSSDTAGRELEKLFSQALHFEERGIPEPLKSTEGMLAHYITTLKARCFLAAISEPVCPSLVHRNWLYTNRDGSESSSVSRMVEYLLVPETVSFFAAKNNSPLLQTIRERAYDFVEPILESKAFPQSDLTDRRLMKAVFETRNVELVSRFWRFGFVFGAETLGDKESFLHLAVANDWNVEQLSRLCDLFGEDKSMNLSAAAQVHDGRGASPFALPVIQGNFPVADYLAGLSPVNDDIDRELFKLDAHESPECTLLGYCLGAAADDIKLQ